MRKGANTVHKNLVNWIVHLSCSQSILTDNKLNLKLRTRKACSRTKCLAIFNFPWCVTFTHMPFGKLINGHCGNYDKSCKADLYALICSLGPQSSIQLRWLKAQKHWTTFKACIIFAMCVTKAMAGWLFCLTSLLAVKLVKNYNSYRYCLWFNPGS